MKWSVSWYEKQRRKAKITVNTYAALVSGIALATSHLRGSSIVLTGIEAKMVYDVALIYGFHLSISEAKLLMESLFATSVILKTLAAKISKFLLVLGWLVAKPSIAGAACKAIGEVAIRYFEDKLQLKLDEAKDKPRVIE